VVVAIDGPSGAGKSTVARAAAQALGFTYLDTGAMYRCVALAAMRSGHPAAEVAPRLRIELSDRVLLDGEDVTAAIRTPQVSQQASRAAADPAVRAAMVAAQQRLIATSGASGWVAEGRDIATAVAPDAEVKVYLTASPAERAVRRARQTGQRLEEVLAEQAIRDERDSTRAHSPLRPADGAVVLDTTELSQDEVVARIVGLARAAQGGPA
jgi:cytidylate kinase